MDSLFEGLTITDHAKTAQNEIIEHLKSKGYSCNSEHIVTYRGDHRQGRIDIVATKNNQVVAIEVDKCSPRKKSMVKLNNFKADGKYVLLRKNITPYSIGDVSVIGLPVKKELI
jgi:hypothetical protein